MAHNYSSSEVLAIANTINRQIEDTTSFWVRGSWGIAKRIATVYHEMPALAIRVSGVYHKGWVFICYNEGNDWYDITFINTRGTVKNTIDGVYADMLGEVLDMHIERGTTSEDEYARKASADTARKFAAADRKYNCKNREL